MARLGDSNAENGNSNSNFRNYYNSDMEMFFLNLKTNVSPPTFNYRNKGKDITADQAAGRLMGIYHFIDKIPKEGGKIDEADKIVLSLYNKKENQVANVICSMNCKATRNILNAVLSMDGEMLTNGELILQVRAQKLKGDDGKYTEYKLDAQKKKVYEVEIWYQSYKKDEKGKRLWGVFGEKSTHPENPMYMAAIKAATHPKMPDKGAALHTFFKTQVLINEALDKVNGLINEDLAKDNFRSELKTKKTEKSELFFVVIADTTPKASQTPVATKSTPSTEDDDIPAGSGDESDVPF